MQFTEMSQKVELDLVPEIQGNVTKFDLIRSECHLTTVLTISSPGEFFSVITDDYKFKLIIGLFDVVLIRNNYQVKVPLSVLFSRFVGFVLTIEWNPTKLYVAVHDRKGFRDKSVITPVTFPPYSLRAWARQTSLLPIQLYESPILMFEAVIEQLQCLKDKIADTNAINGFWNIQYDGSKIISRTPKRETDIHPQIRLLLDDLELLKGLQIIPEYYIGAGRLDFLITGRTKSGEIVNVCVECKLAHAKDLQHGLTVQLPEYMARKATDFGIYCVLYFGNEYPANTQNFNKIGNDYKEKDLEFLLGYRAQRSGLKYLKTMVFDLSRKLPPSKA
ncbi:MAG: hypothetical protein M3209_14975 [Acidobacteriota bacterium]|nr:hypothetical protein [Acidobacteriota bacterium]